MKQCRTCLLVLGVTLMSGLSLSAATSTWDGDTDTLWTTPGNWDTAPAGGEDIVFPNVTGQTVDLGAGTFGIGTLTFNAPDAYALANGTLTLGGNVTQSGAGAVTLNSTTDLGGASRVFNGTGSGVVTFNGALTDTAASGARAYFNGGHFVIGNSANTIDRFVVTNGATLTVVGSVASVPDYPASWFLGGNGTSGGFFGNADGGTLKIEATQPVSGVFDPLTPAVNSAIDWADRAMVFGPNGGTLILNTAPPMGSPTVWYSQGGTSTLVVGEPLPYSGDVWAPGGFYHYRSPFEVEYGVSLGIFQNSSYTYPGATPFYKWRQGSGDFQLILTNGASAYLDWNVMTNGNFIIKGQPGGDSSVIETNATGWTRNVGRFAIRGPHRNGQQYTNEALFPNGTIVRSFYMDQPYGMQFHDAVQVWNRDGMERLVCDMSFENGSSVDFCGGRRRAGLDIGHPGNAALSQAGPTNTMTVKNGGKLNLNLQLRSNIGDGYTSAYGESAGLRVFSFIDIKDGGELKIYRSQTNAMGRVDSQGSLKASKAIELFRPITGNGSSAADSRFVLDLPWSPKSDSNLNDPSCGPSGDNGVNFEGFVNGVGNYPGPNLIVNGSGDYGLRLVGKADYLTNLLTSARLSSLSGSGGTLTIATTDSTPLNIPNGPAAASSVKLGLDKEGSNTPTCVLGTDASLANFAGLVLKSGTAIVEDASSVSMKTLRLAGSATIQLGTSVGGSVLNFDNSSAVAWNAGTLTITSWNGSAAGGGSDQIKVGTDATGLTAGQLAQIKWINPYGGGDVTKTLILSTGEIVPEPPPTIGGPALIGSDIVFTVVAGSASQVGVVQCATNLTPPVAWINVVTNTGAFNFTNAISLPESYYRVLVP